MATTYQWDITQFGSQNPDSIGFDAGRFKLDIEQSAITKALDSVGQSGTTITVVFKEDLPVNQETILQGDAADPPPYGGLVGSHSGEPVQPPPNPVSLPVGQPDGAQAIYVAGRMGSEVIYATHNFCDMTTWYSESVRQSGVTLRDVYGDGVKWVAPGGPQVWVDMRNGKVFDEEGLVEDQEIFAAENGMEQHGYRVVVTQDGAPLTESDPFGGTGGDYSVDYATGQVILSTPAPGAVIAASYSLAGSSGFILPPLPGYKLVLEKSELQFSTDIAYTGTLVMQLFGSSDYFLTAAQRAGLGIPDGANIPIKLSETDYKTIDQLIDEAISAFPEIPALSALSGRGFKQPRHVFQFHYASVRTLFSSLSMYIRIQIAGDQPYGGERATATFYCTSGSDPGPLNALSLLSG